MYLVFIKFIMIGAFVKILAETGKVWACALGFSFVSAFFVLISAGVMPAVIQAIVMSVGAFGYFYLLDRMQGTSTWWLVLILGGLILLALG